MHIVLWDYVNLICKNINLIKLIYSYNSESWNYVFGLASLKARVGVFSFARY